MKKFLALAIATVFALAGCGGSTTSSSTAPSTAPETSTQTPAASAPASSDTASSFDMSKAVAVISREDGSGTRGAFVELMGIEQKDANGNKVDMTTVEASITNSTSVMMTNVAGNPYAVGYISLGSLNDTVKALEIDGAYPSIENIKSGAYKIARPFNIGTTAEVTEITQDFINFIMSAEGQAVVEGSGYISNGNTGAFTSTGIEGKVIVAGSSSVTPVMEKLKEAYLAVNAKATIEVHQSDSTTGMNSIVEGVCDIGMASREVKDSELEKGIVPTVIAIDGIAVIVNNENPVDGLASEAVLNAYVSDSVKWSEIA